MKRYFLTIAVAAGMFAATPALPQAPSFAPADSPSVEAQYGGPLYRGERRFDPRYDRRYGPGRGFGPRRERIVRELPNGCRLITTRFRQPNGTVVVRRERRC
jgi:hypothetical protein